MMEQQQTDRQVHHNYYWCCWPTGQWGALFWGGALVVIGLTWLMSNLGVISEDWWELVIPTLFIGWGIAILSSRRELK